MDRKTLYALVGRSSVALYHKAVVFGCSCGIDSCKVFLLTPRAYPLLERCILRSLSVLGSLAVISHIATGFEGI